MPGDVLACIMMYPHGMCQGCILRAEKKGGEGGAAPILHARGRSCACYVLHLVLCWATDFCDLPVSNVMEQPAVQGEVGW